jgi:hypothetical protein
MKRTIFKNAAKRALVRQRERRCKGRLLAAGFLVMELVAAGQSAGTAAKPPDLTGYWVSVVTTLDWRFRMVVPPKGDSFGLRLTPAARQAADAWDPAKDEAAGLQCKSYGAAGVMRIPARLHITQPDEKTLRVDIDAGTQTRIFHFGGGNASGGQATWQGDSAAEWDMTGSHGLKVVTKHMRAGYLRKNGIPYSEDATMTEYFDVLREGNGDTRLLLTSDVDDPKFLQQPYATSVQFKKQADGSGWDPTPCSARW